MNIKKTSLVTEVVIPPARGGSETRWLLLITCVVLVCTVTAIGLRVDAGKDRPLESWQLNAFTSLRTQEIGVFNALQTAAQEINETHILEPDRWMDIDDLKILYIPPFVEDAAWHKRGEIKWSMKILDPGGRHLALYKGQPTTPAVRGTFLLVMLHDHPGAGTSTAAEVIHAPYKIWLHDNAGQQFPEMITDQALIKAGWKQVIALTGDETTQRIHNTRP
ncbi:MAG: hypothetical protein CSA21_05390 [Deltaproteobacteria bacterium]|nr:MAG: hypothetical protein CSA21_05390 [Deltaproteobacteria bacterium]